MKLLIKGDGTFHGTVVQVIGDDDEPVGELDCVQELSLNIGTNNIIGSAVLKVLNVELNIEQDVQLVGCLPEEPWAGNHFRCCDCGGVFPYDDCSANHGNRAELEEVDNETCKRCWEASKEAP